MLASDIMRSRIIVIDTIDCLSAQQKCAWPAALQRQLSAQKDACTGGNIANGQAAPSVRRVVGIGAVNQIGVMYGHAPFGQYAVHSIGLID